jgi:hypothetical protein
MTERTTKPLAFSSIYRRELVAEFTAGHITSDAGLLLLREADKQVGLIDALDAAIPDPRNPELVTHPQRSAELASSPTLCRLENRIDRKTLVRIARVLVEQFVASFDSPPEELILDIDATDDPVHGDQENRFFHGYYDHHCFLPLNVTCGKQLLVAYLRPANIGADTHARAVLKLLIERLRQAWPGVKILLRGDGGFCRWRLMRWCDSHDVRYLLGLPRNAVLERTSAEGMEQVAEAHRIDGRSHRVFGEFAYAAKSWDRPRRVIAKAEYLRGHGGQAKANPRYVVTNLAGDARTIYEDIYCQRGESENRIKEQ